VGGKSFTAGRGAFEIDAGGTAVVSVGVTRKALKLLKPGKSLSTDGVVAAGDGAGQTSTSTATIRLKRRG
jgi:VCBS repeat-containing protein